MTHLTGAEDSRAGMKSRYAKLLVPERGFGGRLDEIVSLLVGGQFVILFFLNNRLWQLSSRTLDCCKRKCTAFCIFDDLQGRLTLVFHISVCGFIKTEETAEAKISASL